MKTIVFDTEGNGFRDEQLCQLSYIVKDEAKIEGKNYYFKVNAMNEYAQKVHGLSRLALERLSGDRVFADLGEEIYKDFCGADIIVGHNIKSDIQRIRTEFCRCGLIYTPKKKFCTMTHFNNALNLTGRLGQRKYPKLSELCGFYGIEEKKIENMVEDLFNAKNAKQHDARYDAAATYLCLLKATKAGDVKGVI